MRNRLLAAARFSGDEAMLECPVDSLQLGLSNDTSLGTNSKQGLLPTLTEVSARNAADRIY